MERVKQLTELLEDSGSCFVKVCKQIPPQKLYFQLPVYLGNWVAARHIFHILYVEQEIAFPLVQAWLNGSTPLGERQDEEVAWQDSPGLEMMFRQFQKSRKAQIELIKTLAELSLEEIRDYKELGWGNLNLSWVISQSVRHTLNHTTKLLEIAQFLNYLSSNDISNSSNEEETETNDPNKIVEMPKMFFCP